MLDEQFRLAAEIGEVPLRAAWPLFIYINVDVLNVGARLRRPEKLNGREERQMLFPDVLHQAPH